MKLVTNPHIEAGKGLLVRLQERKFQGYVRTCIEELLAGADAGKYTFADLGTTETDVLDLAIRHVGEELLSGHQYPFAFLKLKSDLLCRKSRCEASHIRPPYIVVQEPLAALANGRKAA